MADDLFQNQREIWLKARDARIAREAELQGFEAKRREVEKAVAREDEEKAKLDAMIAKEREKLDSYTSPPPIEEEVAPAPPVSETAECEHPKNALAYEKNKKEWLCTKCGKYITKIIEDRCDHKEIVYLDDDDIFRCKACRAIVDPPSRSHAQPRAKAPTPPSYLDLGPKACIHPADHVDQERDTLNNKDIYRCRICGETGVTPGPMRSNGAGFNF